MKPRTRASVRSMAVVRSPGGIHSLGRWATARDPQPEAGRVGILASVRSSDWSLAPGQRTRDSGPVTALGMAGSPGLVSGAAEPRMAAQPSTAAASPKAAP